MRVCFKGLVLVIACWCAPLSSMAEQGADLGRLFQDSGVDGAVIIHSSTGEEFVSGPERVDRGFLPASTFKILHALIVLDTGVVANEDEIIAWDGVDRGYEPWNSDQTLRSALQHSAVWVFQGFAREIGPERMQHYISLVGYGNENVGGPLDSFWLDGELRISPREQLTFLERLHANDLPFSEHHMEIVKDCLVWEEADSWTMWAKTGWTMRVTPQIGWLVGWVENSREVWFFATNLDIGTREDAQMRFTITMNALERVGAFNESAISP
ncbi:MAG: class D beta-lactamase [Desulfovibrio sp.]|nr:MAG: class D beta-lactamase [Desulfovibrio sp.]